MAALHIGCSGFNYPHWRGAFYPEGLPQRQWLSHYASVFASVELNVTFYRLPKPTTFEKWRLAAFQFVRELKIPVSLAFYFSADLLSWQNIHDSNPTPIPAQSNNHKPQEC